MVVKLECTPTVELIHPPAFYIHHLSIGAFEGKSVRFSSAEPVHHPNS